MRSAVLYIRVSTDEQADKGYSQRHQEEILQRFCLNNFIEIQRTIFEDHSAKTFNRPGWKQMLNGFRKQKRQRPDLVLFTKWDRFSRNAADAYQMIRLLNEYGIEPQAIEQPLDLAIPENKMMLAFYLAAPEVENDRRALNVFHGMRRAKKEGRWMGTAPYGYVNRATDSGRKYICPAEPQASQMKWALTEIAENRYNIEQVWKEMNKKGLNCCRSNFRRLIRNPVYCGKILIPQYKNEPMYWADGLHEPIITEELFLQAQDVIDGRKRQDLKRKFRVPPELYLRGFLICPQCSRILTGSASRSHNGRQYYYYHCQDRCSYRSRADHTNAVFENELAQWKIKSGFTKPYHAIIKECSERNLGAKGDDRTQALKEIEQQQTRLNRARDLFINGDLDTEDFRLVKASHETRMKDLNDILDANPDYADRFNSKMQPRDYSALKLIDFLRLADTKHKRALISLLFPANMVFNKTSFEIKQQGLALKLMYGFEATH
jgi:site-specific DNA recombinase